MTPDIADRARAILRQYNECNDPAHPNFRGPHYITYNRGDFLMRPYGSGARYRYSFRVTPDYDFGRLEEPFYIFNVL